MSIVRWDPFADVDNVFDRMMPRFGRWPGCPRRVVVLARRLNGRHRQTSAKRKRSTHDPRRTARIEDGRSESHAE